MAAGTLLVSTSSDATVPRRSLLNPQWQSGGLARTMLMKSFLENPEYDSEVIAGLSPYTQQGHISKYVESATKMVGYFLRLRRRRRRIAGNVAISNLARRNAQSQVKPGR